MTSFPNIFFASFRYFMSIRPNPPFPLPYYCVWERSRKRHFLLIGRINTQHVDLIIHCEMITSLVADWVMRINSQPPWKSAIEISRFPPCTIASPSPLIMKTTRQTKKERTTHPPSTHPIIRIYFGAGCVSWWQWADTQVNDHESFGL